MTATHDDLVRSQFGATANAYVASAVHASGADLDTIAARAASAAPARALDLGAGGGHVAYAIAPHAGAVVACDLSADMLAAVAAEAKRRGIGNIATQTAAAEALPFADGHFDFLACRFSAHHWRDAEAGLREARRVLAPGAPAIFVDIVAPHTAALDTHLQTVELLRDGSHVRDYGVGEWTAMFARAGFDLHGITRGRLRMDFADWTRRMRTPSAHAAAIRALQQQASEDVARHFAIEPDGSFTIDMALFEVE
ncbi:class I SAM-dependent methyltransferase [Sphingopyxis indica]|uniref:Methyltransferase domain-containing protein n=1 Tax=Sphingopyxis indica TaxID=436663 RepID=A0A239LFG4_9SPHN|nr:class I SAM-dependent methyltransferase [Sphingopyxis indica]SNT29040.1 Methyltransferase domain-containing protein [Sphingopyxis indica]